MFRSLKSILTASASIVLAASAASAQVTAGPIVNPANGHHYFVIQIANFVDYTLAAQNIGGYPVVINDAAENTWIFNNVMPAVPTTYDYAYIGLSDQGFEGSFRWSAGVTDLYTNWNIGEPNNGNGFSEEDFATMRRFQGNWNDLAAPVVGGTLPYAIVEANPVGSEPTGIQYGPICDPATGHLYYLLTVANFDGADQFARNNLRGRLATITSDAENLLMRHFVLLPNVGSLITIGLTDRVTENNFQWISGEFGSFRRWAPGEPNNSGNEDFTAISTAAGSNQGLWLDATDQPRTSIVEVAPCPADFNRSGAVSVQDIFDFLAAYFTGCP